MEFNYIENGINAVVIDNFYTEEQLKEIMLELKWLTKPSILRNQDTLAAAKDLDNGKVLTSKRGIFLEEVFKNWEHSALIKYPMINFQQDEIIDALLKFNPLFKLLYNFDSRTHLLSYYENSDFYKPHIDATVFTILNYFFTEPRKFTGGDLKLYGFKEKTEADVELRHNRVVIITGNTFHELKQLTSDLNNSLSLNNVNDTISGIIVTRIRNGLIDEYYY